MRTKLFVGVLALELWSCAPAHYSYPPPQQAPLAPPAQRQPPRPSYVPPPNATALPSPGRLTARNVDAYMDGTERELRVQLRGSGVGVGRPGDEVALYLRCDLLFDGPSAQLSDTGRRILGAAASVLARYNGTYLTVNGYWDTAGPPDRAYQLTAEQADAVARELSGDGVEARRIATHGLGATHLKIPTGPNKAEARNRRIEITIAPKMAG